MLLGLFLLIFTILASDSTIVASTFGGLRIYSILVIAGSIFLFFKHYKTGTAIIALPILILLIMNFAGIQSTFGNAESQLKDEYTTYWSTITDGKAEDKFACSGRGYITATDDDIIIVAGLYTDPESCTSKKIFNGEDVAVIIDGGQSFSSGGHEGQCTFHGINMNNQQKLIEFKAHTLDKGYDIIENGVKISYVDAPNGFTIGMSCDKRGGGRSSVAGYIKYIGYKAGYCDARDNEVPISESFTTQVNIDSKKAKEEGVSTLSFRVNQFCNEALPFTLRKLGEGIKPIGKAEGITPFNRGETIPSRALESNEVITINYWTPVEECQSKGCKVCGAGEANTKQSDGTFKCQSYLQADEPRTVTERQVVDASSSLNSFVFHSTKIKSSFQIGSQYFLAENKFTCDGEEGVYRAPNPTSSCYVADISYDSFSGKLNDGDSKILNDNLEVQYFSSGDYRIRSGGQTENNLEGNFIFKVTDAIHLQLESIDNTNGIIKFTLTNNLPDSKIMLKSQQRVLRSELNLPETSQEIQAKKGDNSIEVRYDNKNLGINEITIQTFYPIVTDKQYLIEGQGFKFGVDVGTDTPISGQVEPIEPAVVEPAVVEPATTTNSFPTGLIIAIILIVVLAGAVIYLIFKKKR